MKDNNFTIKQFGGKPYRFNKWVFRFAFLLLSFLFVVAVIYYGLGNHIYLNCNVKPMCSNPYYLEWDAISSFGLPYDLIMRENIPYGFTYGNPPPWFAGNEPLLISAILIVAFLINHLLYNRRGAA